MAYNTLFSRRSRLGQGQMKLEEAQPMADKSEAGQRMVRSAAGGSATPGAAGPGFGGIFMRKNLGRTLGILGATLRDISDPSNNALGQFSENEAEQQARDMAMRAYEQRTMDAKQDRGIAMEDRATEQATARAAAQRRAQIDEIIAALPPGQQALALMNPEGYVSGMMRHLYPGPQSGPLVQYVYPGGTDDDGGGWNAGPPPKGGRR